MNAFLPAFSMAIANNIALTTPRPRKAPLMLSPGLSFLAGLTLAAIVAGLML